MESDIFVSAKYELFDEPSKYALPLIPPLQFKTRYDTAKKDKIVEELTALAAPFDISMAFSRQGSRHAQSITDSEVTHQQLIMHNEWYPLWVQVSEGQTNLFTAIRALEHELSVEFTKGWGGILRAMKLDPTTADILWNQMIKIARLDPLVTLSEGGTIIQTINKHPCLIPYRAGTSDPGHFYWVLPKVTQWDHI